MWCSEGLELVFNISEWHKSKIWYDLRGEKCPHTFPNLQLLILRAISNPQRFYEIYTVKTSLTKEDIIEEFETNPQIIVDLIREKGSKIYSDRKTTKDLIV